MRIRFITLGLAFLALAGPAAAFAQETPVCVALTRPLSVGATDRSSGGEVSKLQQFLAADKAIYPEGLVTGYFGPLTGRAVKRWQAAHGIAQVGVVGPLTRAALTCKTAPAPTPAPEPFPPPTPSVPATTTPPTAVPSAPSTLPACTLTTDKEEYEFNSKITISWTSERATYVRFVEGAPPALPVAGSYGPTGTLVVTANVSGTPSITLITYGEESSSCQKTVKVLD